jgi:aminoglycoside phosphotransferase (APT) family kinase protein
LPWAEARRPGLTRLIGEENVDDTRFRRLVEWVRANEPSERTRAFVHGDFNTANVLVQRGEVTGIVDWEFAGHGWREYELAWALRARRTFMNTPAERAAIIEGYRSGGSFDSEQLRFCEVLNYLHCAYWDRESDPEYASFSLDRAADATRTKPSSE